jgi:hypothetical protein
VCGRDMRASTHCVDRQGMCGFSGACAQGNSLLPAEACCVRQSACHALEAAHVRAHCVLLPHRREKFTTAGPSTSTRSQHPASNQGSQLLQLHWARCSATL